MSRKPRPWVRGAAGVVAVVVLAIVIHDMWSEDPAPDYAPVVQPTAVDAWEHPIAAPAQDCTGKADRWIVLGWDGASWELVLPLIAEGALPNLATLIERGSYGPIYGFQPSLSPALWTSVATGVPPSVHGIRGFTKRKHRLARRVERIVRLGRLRRELYSNADRQAPAIWNLLTEHQRRVLIVGFHNTFPAEQVDGIMVSNFLQHAYVRKIMRANTTSHANHVLQLVHPPDHTAELLELERGVQLELPQAIREFAQLTEAQWQDFHINSMSLEGSTNRRQYFLRRAWWFDTFHGRAALSLFQQEQPDLTWVHFQGIDFASHYFLYFHDREGFRDFDWDEPTRAELDRQLPAYRDTLRKFYVKADRWLGQMMELAGPSTGIVLLSDHGFRPEDDPARGGHHHDAPPGMLVIAGPGIRSGERLSGATLYDILPTLLSAFELPVAQDLAGKPLQDAFCATTWNNLRHVEVASYASDGFGPVLSTTLDSSEEALRELRALGYVD